jgi:hypothetical protein
MTSEEVNKLKEIIKSFGITDYGDVSKISGIRNRGSFAEEILNHPRSKAKRTSDIEKALKEKDLYYKF